MADRSADADDEESSPRRGVIGGIVGRVAPTVIRQIDMDAVIVELDINAIAEQLDLDALMDRLDMDALVDKLDVNAIADKLDIDALMDRLDMDALVDKLDVNAIADKLDIDELMTRIDMAQMTAGVTQDVAISGLDLVRRQLVRGDAIVDGFIGRFLRRQGDDRPVAPALLAAEAAPPAPRADDGEDDRLRRRDVSGHYAGPVTRLLALGADVWAALTTFGIFTAATLYLLGILLDEDFTDGTTPWAIPVLAGVWLLLWFWVPIGLFGRTVAMALSGLAVVRRDGAVASGRSAFVRAVVQPFSLLFLGLGLIGMFVGRERRTLHDVVAGTAVVYDWGARQAEQPVSIREQLSARVGRRRVATDPANELASSR